MNLRTRVALLMGLGMALVALCQGLMGYLSFQRLVLNDTNRDLKAFTTRLSEEIAGAGSLQDLDVTYEGYVVHARLLKDQQLTHNLTTYPPELTPPTQGGYHTVGVWRVTQQTLNWQGQTYALQTALTSPEFTAGLHNYRLTVGYTALMVTLLGAAVAYLLSGYALRPLRTLTRLSSRIAQSGQLQERLPDSGLGQGEILELSRSFNGMLSRLAEFRTREARFHRQAAHELRTPLTAMSLALDTAQAGYTTPTETYQVLAEEIRYTRRLSESLLILAREGRLAHSEPVDLAALARECAQSFGASYLGPPHAWLDGDAGLLRRALENLLENAARYAPETPMTVQLSDPARPGAGLHLTVQDSGPGLPDEALPHLTDEFYRVSSQHGGAGLGLSVVKHVMLAHQGRVTFENVAPRGLHVTLHFPEHLTD